MNMADTSIALQTHWNRLRPLIQRAVPLMGGTHNEEDLIKAVLAGEMTFWPGKKSFALAVLERFPRLTRAHVILANSEDQPEMLRLAESITAWAKALGATELVADVRPGVDRLYGNQIATHDYKRTRVTLVRKI